MKLRIKLLLPPQARGVVRWSGRFLLVIGILALGYVGITLLEARMFQASAGRMLESQRQVEKEHRVQPSHAVGSAAAGTGS